MSHAFASIIRTTHEIGRLCMHINAAHIGRRSCSVVINAIIR